MNHKQIKAKILVLENDAERMRKEVIENESRANDIRSLIGGIEIEVIDLEKELAKHECTKADLNLTGIEEITFGNGVYANYKCRLCGEKFTQWFVVTDHINRDEDGEEMFLKDK